MIHSDTFFFLFILFIYFWLCWVFVSVQGLFLVAASGGHSSSRCAGLSLLRPLLLRSAGSVIVAHGPSCSVACGIFPDQGSNPCPLHWQVDSQPPRHQGGPLPSLLHWLYVGMTAVKTEKTNLISLQTLTSVSNLAIFWGKRMGVGEKIIYSNINLAQFTLNKNVAIDFKKKNFKVLT